MLKLFHITNFLLVTILSACSGNSGSTSLRGASKGLVPSNPTLVASDTNTSTSSVLETKIDASTMKITSLTVGNYAIQGAFGSIVEFTTMGSPLYLSWTICPTEASNQDCDTTPGHTCGYKSGTCIDGVANDSKLLLPTLWAGKIQLTVKACLDPQKALDPKKNCGPTTQMYYDSRVRNAELADALAEKARIFKSVDELAVQSQTNAQTYMTDLEACIKFDAASEALYRSKIRVVDQFLNVPGYWVTSLYQKVVTNAPQVGTTLNGAKDAGTALIKPFKEICYGTSKSTDEDCLTALKDQGFTGSADDMNNYCTKETRSGFQKFCSSLATTVGSFAEMMNPVMAIQTVSDAIHDISDPDHSVTKKCVADDRFNTNMEMIDKQVQYFRSRIQDINQKLKDAGEM